MGSSATMKSGSAARERARFRFSGVDPRALVRISPGRVCAQADKTQKLLQTGENVTVAIDAQCVNRFGQNRPNRHARIERRIGVLEDHLHMPSQRAHITHQGLVSIKHLAGRCLLQAKNCVPEFSLSAP